MYPVFPQYFMSTPTTFLHLFLIMPPADVGKPVKPVCKTLLFVVFFFKLSAHSRRRSNFNNSQSSSPLTLWARNLFVDNYLKYFPGWWKGLLLLFYNGSFFSIKLIILKGKSHYFLAILWCFFFFFKVTRSIFYCKEIWYKLDFLWIINLRCIALLVVLWMSWIWFSHVVQNIYLALKVGIIPFSDKFPPYLYL